MNDKRNIPADEPTERGIRSGGDSLLDHIDVPLYAVDGGGLCVRINRAGEHLLGYTQAEVLGQDMHTLVHSRYPDGREYPASECPLLHARSAGKTIRGLDEVLWSRDGLPVPVEYSASPVVMDDGSLGAVVTMKDLRGRKLFEARSLAAETEQAEVLRQRDAMARIEREAAAVEVGRQRDLQIEVEHIAANQLRAQQKLLGMVAETAPVGIAVLDAEVRYRWTNESYQRSMDPAFATVRLQGTSFFDVVPEINREELRAIVRAVQQTGKTYTADEYALSGIARGMTYWNWSLSRLENGDLMSTGAEVTDAVRARAEVETVYANAPIALALVDAKTMLYLRGNVKYAEICGISPDRLIGERAGSFSVDTQGNDFLQRAATGETIRNEPRELYLAYDMLQLRSLLLNATPNRNAHGELDTISLAVIDVTAQKRAEGALVQADKLAAVGRLAASISHEINNPLEAVTNLLYLVHSDQTLSEESVEYIKLAESELARVSQIASQTLRFHRHASKPTQLSPQQVVDPVVALYQGRLKNSRVTVDVQHRGGTHSMFLHEGDVRQILNNLLGNAIDAMPNGGTVTIRTRPACCARTRHRGTRISISDEGHGMSPDTVARIFEPFFTTKGSSGSGLGLWISHTIAQRHNGTLQVRSRQRLQKARARCGTVFSLFLPDQSETDRA